MAAEDREGPDETFADELPVEWVTPDLLERYDRPGPRYTSYPTAVEFSEAFAESEYRERLARAREQRDAPLSLYVHLPFCVSRCTFCGCNVVITRKREVSERYLRYLEREIGLLADHLGPRRKVLQMHWGGGTPTYLDLGQIEKLHRSIRDFFDLLPGAEAAVEVDPRVTTIAQLRLLRDLGFNRLSLGIQDFTPGVQLAVNRLQSVDATRRIVDAAREMGFRSVNVDLIYGLPRQDPAGFEKTLSTVLAMRPDRVAVYSFAYVPWIRGNQRRIDPEELPSRERKFELFALAVRSFLGAGYRQIGMDHFALPEDELARAVRERMLHRNFMGYTVCRAPDVVGVGVSSIGDVAGAYVQNVKKLSAYYRALGEGRFPVERGLMRTGDDEIRRRVILELMCNFAVEARRIEEEIGIDFHEYFREELDQLRSGEGPAAPELVRISARGVEVTPLGRLFVRNVAMVFDRHRRSSSEATAPFSRTV